MDIKHQEMLNMTHRGHDVCLLTSLSSVDTESADDPAPAPGPGAADPPPFLKTSSWTRQDEQKKSCPSEWGLFSPTPWGPGKKKLCLITRTQYREDLKSPVYPCSASSSSNPDDFGVPKYGTCRSDPLDGNTGKI